MDAKVTTVAAVRIYDVEDEEAAVQIAISKVGDMLNPDLNYVEINTTYEENGDTAFVTADEALVSLDLTMDVFNVEQEEHAERVARKEIGERLSNISLEVTEVDLRESDEEYDEDYDGDDEEEHEEDTDDTHAEEESETLPEFDELTDDE